MRSIAKLMKDWQFTGPNGVTTAVELPHTCLLYTSFVLEPDSL